jgi:hypothetical protein
MSRFRLLFAVLILAASVPGPALAGWGFSYHSYAPPPRYCPAPVFAPYVAPYGVPYYPPPYAAPYVPHHHHWHGPPRGAFFFGF